MARMSRVAIAALSGLLLGGLATGAYFHYLPAANPDKECGGFCAEGTECVEEQCVPTSAKKQKRRKGRRSTRRKKRRIRRAHRSRAKADSKQKSSAKAKRKKIPWVNDKHIPAFDANAMRVFKDSDGSGRLDEFEIDQSLAALDEDFGQCIEHADARAEGQLKNGRVDFSFGVNGKGKVIGVNASAPSHLKRYGIVPCVRKAVYGQRFRAFDGPDARVSSSFEVVFD